ncbi:MAG: hypothetical protein ACR2QX_06680 [Woeseiaceae bacterium]
MNTRNANIWVYEDGNSDVVTPFLVGEVAGSLAIAADRAQLKQFAETILDWLARTDLPGGTNVYRFTPKDGTRG